LGILGVEVVGLGVEALGLDIVLALDVTVLLVEVTPFRV
jgi:hypothetical protein